MWGRGWNTWGSSSELPHPVNLQLPIHPFMRPLEWVSYLLIIPKEAVTNVTPLTDVIKHLTRDNSREICFMVGGMVHPIMQWRNRRVARKQLVADSSSLSPPSRMLAQLAVSSSSFYCVWV